MSQNIHISDYILVMSSHYECLACKRKNKLEEVIEQHIRQSHQLKRAENLHFKRAISDLSFESFKIFRSEFLFYISLRRNNDDLFFVDS